MDSDQKVIFSKIANTIRHLSIDAIQTANSGHPGIALGCAELSAYLYGKALTHNPKNPSWINRDRFILSAGHGSAMLYSCLHLAGFDITLDDIKDFRQLNSNTPGHPEANISKGIETTSGPLGQGIGCAIGMSLGMKLLATRFNTDEHTIIDNKIFVLGGDGCFMEGVSAEAASLAGHLQLDNIIAIYDSNMICLDGPISEVCSEDTMKRFEAYGWDVYNIDGHDFDAIDDAIKDIRETQERPCLIIAQTLIGKGSPNKTGTHKVHGSPLGEEEVIATKEALGLPKEKFFIPQAVIEFFKKKRGNDNSDEIAWKGTFNGWTKANPDMHTEFEKMTNKYLPDDLENRLKSIKIKSPMAGRAASHTVINYLTDILPQFYGGSADLSCSDMTMLNKKDIIAPGIFHGRNIKFGVREFCMGTMATGLSQTGMITPFCGTFLVFSDYMRNAIRLAAMQHAHVIYQFTHDSIFLGEDGPTHQPVEQLASLRAIPNLQVIRPADNNEVKMAWIAALTYKGPTAIVLSRQALRTLKNTETNYSEGVGRGAYIIKKEKTTPNFTLFATGSELSLALDVATELEKCDKSVRVVSMPCWEIFEQQPDDYKAQIIGGDLGKRVSIEAAVDMGWHKYIGINGTTICVEGFGASAPICDLMEEYGFTVESILERIF